MSLFSSLRAPVLLLLEVTVLLSIGPVSGDNLLLVQPIWRHGDRSPTTTYPKDPNQESAWPLGWGQLTPVIFYISSKF
ncbi:unnamed protein product [Anisakis simplex]|uniref:Lysosomal acid phosphatase n=1 Tax=Anisakis simplex TaxID=6269 RepID=A0A0M3J2E3_ANISI|nr:unnamed protein product [Anisakis simplex]